MFPVRFLIIASAVTLMIVAGCAKKSKPTQIKNTTQVSETQQTPDIPSDSVDIFDQFYKDELENSSDTDARGNVSMEKSFSTSPDQSNTSTTFVENGRYVIQISTVFSQRMADNLAAKLNGQGFPAYVAAVENPTPALTGTYYRIRVGGFNAVSDAKNFARETLEPNGYEYWVDNRSNDNIGIQGSGFGAASAADTYAPSAASAPSSSYESTSSWDSTPASSPAESSPAAAPTESSTSPTPGFGSSETPPSPAESTEPPSDTSSGTSEWGTESGW